MRALSGMAIVDRTPATTPSPTPTVSPAPTTLTAAVPPAIPALPVYLSPVADTTWGTRITRVSNVANRRHGYARTPGWNADGSKILLAFSSPAAILDGRTYAQLYTLSSMVGYAHWSNTNPNRIFGTFNNDNRFYAENATTGAQTVLHTFSGYTEVSLGDGEGGIDDNDRYVALMTRTSAGANGLIVYDIGTDTVVSSLNIAATRPDNAQISRKGNYVVLTWGDGTGFIRDSSGTTGP